MRVLRVEHLYCPNGKVHGPASGGYSCDDWEHKPSFGTRGPTPDGEVEPHRIKEHEICGVLPEQFDAWWSGWDYENPRTLYAKKGWVISEYEVPDEDVRVLRWQVVFPRESARRVNCHYNPEPFVPLRRPDLPPIGVSAYEFFAKPYAEKKPEPEPETFRWSWTTATKDAASTYAYADALARLDVITSKYLTAAT